MNSVNWDGHQCPPEEAIWDTWEPLLHPVSLLLLYLLPGVSSIQFWGAGGLISLCCWLASVILLWILVHFLQYSIGAKATLWWPQTLTISLQLTP